MNAREQRGIMKACRLMMSVAAIGLALSVSACSQQKAEPAQQAASAAQSPQAAPGTRPASPQAAPSVVGGDALATAKPADQSPSKLEKVGEKTKEIAVKTKDVTGDALILAKIKAKFLDDTSLKGCAFNVDIKDNVATLKGFATSEAAKAKAESIVKETKGVNRVVNEVVVAK